jgi:hypothetical protein
VNIFVFSKNFILWALLWLGLFFRDGAKQKALPEFREGLTLSVSSKEYTKTDAKFIA